MKSLLKTNIYLKDLEKRKKIIETVVISSSSIEGVRTAAKKAVSKTRIFNQASASSLKAHR